MRPPSVSRSLTASASHRVPKRESLTASAHRVTNADATEQYSLRLAMPWQQRSIFYSTVIPELQYASGFYARMLQKIKIYPAYRLDDDTTVPITEGDPVKFLNRIQDPGGGRTQLQYRYGKFMFTTGECYLFGRNLGRRGHEKWSMVWREELQFDSNDRVTHMLAPQLPMSTFTFTDDNYEELPEGSAEAYRMWTPALRFSGWPASPFEGVMDMSEELLILSRAVHATATSRLVKSKLLFLPAEMEPTPVDANGDEDPASSPYLQDLVAHILDAIEDPGSAGSLAPYITFMDGELISQIRDLTLHDPTTDYLEKDLRKECIERIGQGLDLPQEVIKGMSGTNHWCQPIATKVYKRGIGWVGHGELRVGDQIRSLNHETGMSEWDEVTDIYRADVVDEPMLSISGRDHESLSTMNHRWPVLRGNERVWTTSQGLLPKDKIIRSAPASDLPLEASYSDEFVELVAWFVTDGTCTWPSPKNCQVRIGQSHVANPEMVLRIRGVLTRLFGPPHDNLVHARSAGAAVAGGWREGVEKRGMTMFNLNKAAYGPLLDVMESWRSKVVKLEFVEALTSAQLQLFLTTAGLGDGTARNGGGVCIEQRDPRRLVPFELAAILSDKATVTRQKMTGGFGKKQQTFLSALTRMRTVAIADRTEVVPYTGTIWCPVTKNTGSWLAQHSGKSFYTGNSAWWISDDMWRSHGEPMAEQFCDDLSEAYLRPALEEAGFERWDEVVVAFDASGVVVNPDRSKDADQAFDRGELGGKGYRVMKNIPEDYAPTDEERAIYLAKNKVLLGPDGQVVPDSGDKVNPGDEPGPPDGEPGDVSEGTNLPASAFQGAAELALYRCRELAGSRIRSRRKSCPGCLDEVQHIENSLVAAALGTEGLEPLGSPSPQSLVAGGADAFKSLLVSWGNDDSSASAIAHLVETHAARTLMQERPSISQLASLEMV